MMMTELFHQSVKVCNQADEFAYFKATTTYNTLFPNKGCSNTDHIVPMDSHANVPGKHHLIIVFPNGPLFNCSLLNTMTML